MAKQLLRIVCMFILSAYDVVRFQMAKTSNADVADLMGFRDELRNRNPVLKEIRFDYCGFTHIQDILARIG